MTCTRTLLHRTAPGPGRATVDRWGATLIELIVVLAILGIMAAVVGLSFTRPPSAPAPGSSAAALNTIAAARRTAIARGTPIAVAVSITGSPESDGKPRILRATAFPDGSVIADPSLGIDRLSGRAMGRARARE